MTSSIDPTDIEKAKKYSEISNYIVKPISLEELKQLIV
jgi:CheY-like chemotaxis protein